jgi:hypothetical protein
VTRLARLDDVCRLDLGFLVRPAIETGTGQPRVEAVSAYLVHHPEPEARIGAIDRRSRPLAGIED